jgi:hypothetical protein
MTRETKVGLVVAGSFLCLVGVVLALKLGQAEEPPGGKIVAQAPPAAPTPPATNPKKPDLPGQNPSVGEPHAMSPVVPASAQQLEPNPSATNPGVSPPTGPTNTPPGGIVPPPAEGGNVALPQVGLPPENRVEVSPPAVPAAPTSVEQQLAAQQQRSIETNPINAPPPPPVVAPTPLPPVTEPTPNPTGTPENKIGGLPAPPPTPAGLAPVVSPPVIPPAPGAEKMPSPPTGTNPLTPAPPVPVPTGNADPQVPEIKGSISIVPSAPVPPAEAASPKAIIEPPANPPPSISPPTPAIDKSNVSPPPVGIGDKVPAGVPVAVSPPRPVEAPQPQVRVTETKIHVIEAKDRTFADLSTRFYNTPAYAEALLKFNRDYPMAGDKFRQNPPVLQPGQRVFIPDVATLQQGTAVPTTQITPAPTVPPIAVPPTVAPVSPPPPPVPAPGGGMSSTSNLRPVASTAGKAEGKAYQVASGGEMILTIAERELGSRDRWSEIYRLNQQLDPRYLIPAGTVLRMPAGQ